MHRIKRRNIAYCKRKIASGSFKRCKGLKRWIETARDKSMFKKAKYINVGLNMDDRGQRIFFIRFRQNDLCFVKAFLSHETIIIYVC